MIKHIFSDMDGTLLNSAGKISPDNLKAIKEYNIPLTLVSARAPVEMEWATKQLGLSDYQICFNGGLVIKWDEGNEETIYEKYLERGILLKVCQILRSEFPDISLSLYSDKDWYTDKVDEGVLHQKEVTYREPIVGELSDVIGKSDVKIFKLTLITFNQSEMSKLKRLFAELNLSSINAHQTSPYHFEVTNIAAKKSNGVKHVMAELGLVGSDIMVIGDGDNDISMLRLAKYPVAMGNAAEHIHKEAVFVTETNDNHGVSYSIKKFMETPNN